MYANAVWGSFRGLLAALADEFREDESLPLEGSFVSEIDEVANGLAGDAHIVEQLTLVLGRKISGFMKSCLPLASS
jgi:hypothetical protein